MYRINKVCIDLLLLLILSVSSLSAQVATTTSNGYPAIDLSDLAPMGAVLSSAEADKRRTDMNKQALFINDYLAPAGSTFSGTNGTWNAKMSIKYQVMRADLETTSNWTSAWKACKAYDKEGGAAGTWRLPTQRELMMIWILHPQLIEKGGFTAFSDDGYWSATEASESRTCTLIFKNGNVGTSGKGTSFSIRCVRDI